MTREHSVSSTAAKTTPLGGKVWFCLLFFGLIGQIAWIVENMYFAKFMQDEFVDEAWATTLMVALSAIFATAATVVTGAICDKTGKRSVYVSWGFILWGLTIMVFALFPIDYSPEQLKGLVAGIVIMDCVMSWVGSSANDAAFNTWLTDMTDTTNRGKADTVLSMMPVFAMVVVFIGLDSLTAKGTEQWWLFFVILGAIPIVSGILGLFVLKDKPNLPKNTNPNFGKELIYGFRPSVIKKNKMLYIALAGSGIAGASMQVYMSYLINFVERTLGMTDYVMPLAVIIVCSAVLAGVLGFLIDKFGRKHFFIPLVAAAVIGTLGIYLLKFLFFFLFYQPPEFQEFRYLLKSLRLTYHPVQPFHPDILKKCRRPFHLTGKNIKCTSHAQQDTRAGILPVLHDPLFLKRRAFCDKYNISPRTPDFVHNLRIFIPVAVTCNYHFRIQLFQLFLCGQIIFL